jgi:hypothetical protein
MCEFQQQISHIHQAVSQVQQSNETIISQLQALELWPLLPQPSNPQQLPHVSCPSNNIDQTATQAGAHTDISTTTPQADIHIPATFTPIAQPYQTQPTSSIASQTNQISPMHIMSPSTPLSTYAQLPVTHKIAFTPSPQQFMPSNP